MHGSGSIARKLTLAPVPVGPLPRELIPTAPNFIVRASGFREKWHGCSHVSDHVIKTGRRFAKNCQLPQAFYLFGDLRMQFRQHNH